MSDDTANEFSRNYLWHGVSEGMAQAQVEFTYEKDITYAGLGRCSSWYDDWATRQVKLVNRRLNAIQACLEEGYKGATMDVVRDRQEMSALSCYEHVFSSISL